MHNTEVKKWNFFKYTLEITVFVCGAVVMMYEIIGSRVMAPYVGTSTYAWTSLIGVILAALSAGYYAGGRAADAKPDIKLLATIILASSLGIVFTNLLKDPISAVASLLPVVLELKTLILAAILFAPSSFLLGMVSPYAVRLKISDIATTGRTAGNLYALSTLGSIIGTFAAGFLVIPLLGTAVSLFLLSIILLLVSMLLYGREIFVPRTVALFFIVLGLSFYSVFAVRVNAGVIDLDTEYNRVWIMHTREPKTDRLITGLQIDPYGIQAGIYADAPDEPVFDYIKFFRLAEHFVREPKSALLIGGSVLTFPRVFLKQFPAATLDSVEIDPGMTELARRFFGFTDDPRLTLYHEDGRMFLNREAGTRNYDIIFNDAFTSASSVPFQLTTREAVSSMYTLLNDNGAIITNLISAVEGDAGKFLRAEYATYAEFFPHVYVFPVKFVDDGTKLQNIILVALKEDREPSLKSENSSFQAVLSHRWTKELERDVPVLTDDYAPVDYYRRLAL